MKKRILFPAVFIGLVTALFILGCNNVLLNKEQDQKFSISFVTPTITQAASSASRSATGADWKITAWLELENGSRLQTKELTAKADQPASIAFDQVVVGTSLRVKVELDAINDATVKFSGASNVIQVSEEGTVVQLSVERIKVPAPAPSITQQPEGKTQTDVGDDGGDSFSHILNIVVDSPSTDGQLQYQWYSNDSPSTTGSTPLTDDDADPENIKVTVFKGKTKYFYCVVTNDIVDNQYVTPTSVTSNIVKVAYLPKTLTRIEAKYNGSPMMVDSLDYSNFSVIETYSDNTTNELSSIESQYAVTIPEKSIGYVPVTIKNRQSEDIQDQITVPIKYELDANYLTITGDASVEQNEELKLTAEYKVDGKDSYNLYTSASSSGSYKIIENVNISWQGATKQQNAWEALAETSNAGTGKTATVTLTPKDEWCVTTSGVEKSHSYEVTEPAPSYDPTVGLSWADSTLTIYNEAGLINFRKIVNGDVSSSAPITVGDKTFSGQDRTVNARLAADIALTEESWTPIANNSTYPYAGTFDGAGHTVSGINVEGGGNPKGFFGSIGTNKAIIKNLTVEGTVDVSYYAGGIAGYVDGGTIEYCVNKINVTSTAAGGTGGIAGYIAGSGATITGCVNFGAVQGNNYAGGIAGSSYSNSTTSPKIAHCINFGSVKTTDSSSKASGIYGFSVKTSDSITNCANFGTITSSNSGSGAGITNTDNYLTIQYCLSAGAINATKIYAVASSTSGTQTKNYYDSSKITQTQSQASGNAGRATSELKAANAWDTSWTTTNWSFAAGRYPVPNIQDNIPSDIWKDIVEKAQQ